MLVESEQSAHLVDPAVAPVAVFQELSPQSGDDPCSIADAVVTGGWL